MVASEDCVVFITGDGKLFSMGSSSKGMLGLGPEMHHTKNVAIPIILDESNPDEPVIDIKLGASHFLALTSSGRVYGWGNNTNGQVGVLNTPENLGPEFNPDGTAGAGGRFGAVNTQKLKNLGRKGKKGKQETVE